MAGGEGLVTQIKDRLLIEEYLDLASFRDDTKCMPLSDINDLIEVLKHMPDALDDPVDANILFQWIRSRQVVVAIIGGPPNQAASHIGFALNRQK